MKNTEKQKLIEEIKNGLEPACIPEKYRDDKSVMMKAIRQHSFALEYASDRLKNDKNLVLKAVKDDGDMLKYASNELRDNKEVVLEAVKNRWGCALKYASDRLKDDLGVVMVAIDRHIDSIEYASDRLKDNRDVMLDAIWRRHYEIEYASDRLKHDYDFIVDAYKANRSIDSPVINLDAETKRLINSAKKMIEEKKPSLSSVLGKAEKASQEHNSKLNTQSRDDKDLEK